MQYIAYLRISTEDQVQSGAGLAAQENAVTAFVDACKGQLTALYKDEGISGAAGLDKRPALMRAIGALGKGDCLIVAKRDRLGRDPIVVAMIEASVKRKGARIVSAAGEGTEGDGPSDILMRRIVDAFAEYERLIIRARTSAALQAKKAKRERTGAIPYGFQLAADGVHLLEEPLEQRILNDARMLHRSGHSLRAIAKKLAEKGFVSRSGKQFDPKQIQRILAA